ncbi:MAG: hypothetical protein AB1571_03785 [Nanoarchaeota archaeon]
MKRGQVTLFIILGIVILVVIALIFGLRNIMGIGIGDDRFLSLKMGPLADDLNKCIKEKANNGIVLIGKQGGTLKPIKYRLYNGNKVNYLCYNLIGDERCSNRMVLLSNMEKELNDYLQFELANCVDTRALAKKLFYKVTVGRLSVDTKILRDNVVVNVKYPITISKGSAALSQEDFSQAISRPLGDLYNTVYDIVDSEASSGQFLQLPYMLAKRGSVEINVDKPYPDKVYILNKKNDNYIFQFAVEGE